MGKDTSGRLAGKASRASLLGDGGGQGLEEKQPGQHSANCGRARNTGPRGRKVQGIWIGVNGKRYEITQDLSDVINYINYYPAPEFLTFLQAFNRTAS